MDGHFDKRRNTEDFNSMGRIVGVDFGGFGDLPLIILGIHFQCNLSLPAGEDGLIKKGDRAASPRLDLFNEKGLVALVKDLEDMFDRLTLVHLLIVNKFLIYNHSRA